MLKIKSYKFLVLIGIPLFSHAESKSVFGFELGQEFSAAPCSGTDTVPLHPKEGYCPAQNKYKPLKSNPNGLSGQAKVLFKFNELPFWTASKFDIQLVEGKLEGIIVTTGGRTTHLSVTDDLIKKYGEPQNRMASEVQNQLGGKFENNILIWDFGDTSITYIPILGDIKTGKIEFFTGREEFKRTLNESSKSSRPL